METISFENYLYKINHSESTVKSYVYSVGVFLADRKNALSLKYKDIIEYLTEKEKANQNANIKKQLLPGIKKYYDYLVETHQRNNHPCRALQIKLRKSRDITLHDLFSSEELELLLEREERYKDLKLRNQAVISVLICQGLTAGEITRLKINHIDLDKGILFIKNSRKNAGRHLEIQPRQYRILDRYIHESRKKLLKTETDSFAIGKLGTVLTKDDIHYLVSTYKGLFPDRNLNPQTIRQSVISNWMNEKKLPLEQVQLMAGHKWISSTIKYRRANIEEQRGLMNKWFPI